MWDMPWTDSATLIARRINEELLKRLYGEPKAQFTIPIQWIDEFELFSNLRLQDPFGVSSTGAGEVGRYYYIESISYDFLRQTMTIKAVDLQFILRQIMLVAHCDWISGVEKKWSQASDTERMYAYVGNCDTEVFDSDGSPLKRVSDCDE